MGSARWLVLAFVLLGTHSMAFAQPDETPEAVPSADAASATAAYEQAVVLLGEGKPAEATAVLERSFGLVAAKETLWAWAQAERQSGNCPKAVILYQRFLAEFPEGDKSGPAARSFIRECEETIATTKVAALIDEGNAAAAASDWLVAKQAFDRALATDPTNTSARVGQITATAQLGHCSAAQSSAQRNGVATRADVARSLAACSKNTTPATEVSSSYDWHESKPGWLFSATGAALVVGGGVLATVARSRAQNLDEPDYQTHNDNFTSAKRSFRIGLASVGVGALLAAYGVYRFVKLDGTERATVKVSGSAEMATVSLRGRF